MAEFSNDPRHFDQTGCSELTKYWAFISYSQRDRKWGEWLIRALETYRIPKPLVGKQTPSGVVPTRLTPIFRDRDELSGAADNCDGLLTGAVVGSRPQLDLAW
jgi:hypothetical protein